jgi:hypothetical protein
MFMGFTATRARHPQRGRLSIGQWLLAVVVILVLMLCRSLLLPENNHPEDRSPASISSTKNTGNAASTQPSNEATVDQGESDQPLNGTPATPTAKRQSERQNSDLGELREIGSDVYLSSAGLKYRPGSREGHRLKHILLHSKDQPNRPGSHGVFHGGREGTLKTIDQAYVIARSPGPRVQKKTEGPRTVLTVDLGRNIGYVGGQNGRRQGNPEVRHVRLVLEGTNLITAFPLDVPARNRRGR